MLWRKAWLETRWRFLIGFGLLLCSAAATVFTFPQVQRLLPHLAIDVPGELGRRIRESAALAREYRGFVWTQWCRQNATQMATIFAALLGTAGVLSQSRGALYTLSLPVSRDRLLGVRAATGLAELVALAFLPTLLIPLLSPAIGETYSVESALVHGLCLFVVAAMYFGLAFLLSTVFDDPWRPLLIALGIAFALALAERFLAIPGFGVFRIMSGEDFFRGSGVPWAGLLATAAVAAALHWAALRNFARRDF
jgi:hypothetical protein